MSPKDEIGSSAVPGSQDESARSNLLPFRPDLRARARWNAAHGGVNPLASASPTGKTAPNESQPSPGTPEKNANAGRAGTRNLTLLASKGKR